MRISDWSSDVCSSDLLGGNDPLIVMEDADLDKAAELAVAGATKNSGQRCTAVKRILAVESIADEFSKLVVEKAKRRKSGDRSEERRGGKEGVSTGRRRWWPSNKKKNTQRKKRN